MYKRQGLRGAINNVLSDSWSGKNFPAASSSGREKKKKKKQQYQRNKQLTAKAADGGRREEEEGRKGKTASLVLKGETSNKRDEVR